MAIQDRFKRTNTVYKITQDIDLEGNTLTIPEGCTLDFQGGSFFNGVINGNQTSIKAAITQIFKDNLSITGSWNISQSFPEWFGAKGDGLTDDTDCIQKAVDILSDNAEVCFTKKYKIFGVYENAFNRRQDGIHIKSNIQFSGKAGAQLIADTNCCNIFTTPPEEEDLNAPKIKNVRFYNLELIHTHQSLYQFSALINLANIDNCIIEGCKFLSYCGDGITIGALLSPNEERWMTSFANDITIRDCVFDGKNIISRQGISVYVCNNITIDNNIFKNSSGDVMPGAIDFEPEADVEIKNVKIINNHFENIKGVVGTVAFVNPVGNTITADRFIIENNTFVGSNSHDIYVKLNSPTTCNLIIAKNTFIKSKIYFLVENITEALIVDNVGEQLQYGNGVSNVTKLNFLNNIMGDSVGLLLGGSSCVFDNCGSILIDGNFYQRINVGAAFTLKGVIGSAIIKNNRVNAWEASNVKFVELAEDTNLDRYIFKDNLCGAPSDIGEYNDLSYASSAPFNLNTLPDDLPVGLVSTIVTADYINQAPLNAEGGLLMSIHPTNGYYKGLTKQLFFPMYVRGEQPYEYLFIRKREDNNTWSSWLRIQTASLNTILSSGSSSQRPDTILTPIGFEYFDSTLNKPIWVNSSKIWVDSTGATV